MVEHKIQSSDVAAVPPTEPDGSGPGHGADRVQGKKLVVNLDPVPKFLKRLVEGWAPEGMIVSFKLETNPSLLVVKAQQALERYSHHLVIGNLLSTRKWEVVFIAPGEAEKWIRVPKHRRTKSVSGLERQVGLAATLAMVNGEVKGNDSVAKTPAPDDNRSEMEIESLIVPEVVRMHTDFIERAKRGRMHGRETRASIQDPDLQAAP